MGDRLSLVVVLPTLCGVWRVRRWRMEEDAVAENDVGTGEYAYAGTGAGMEEDKVIEEGMPSEQQRS